MHLDIRTRPTCRANQSKRIRLFPILGERRFNDMKTITTNLGTKILAAIVLFAFVAFGSQQTWQVAAVVTVVSLAVYLIAELANAGKGWLLLVYGLLAVLAHAGMPNWSWNVAFAGFGFYVIYEFLVESKLVSFFKKFVT